MTTCNFCGENIEPGTGKIFVKLDGRVLHFCSNKCEKNHNKLGRKPRNTRWTNEYQEKKKKSKVQK